MSTTLRPDRATQRAGADTPLAADDVAAPVGRDYFGEVAATATRIAGGKWAFLVAAGVIVVWGISGPIFRYSENWQLLINTGTTIVTFLMVFLIQNAQNRESKAIHLKLDELIRALGGARNELIDVESLTEEQLEELTQRYRRFAERYHSTFEMTLKGVERGVGRLERDVEEVEKSVEEVEKTVERVERALIDDDGGE